MVSLTLCMQMHTWTQPSYCSKYMFLKLIDQLPTGAEWTCKLMQAHSEMDQDGETPCMDEELELWLRDPVACIHEIIGNRDFHGDIAYAPEKVYSDDEGRTQRYNEMWTWDWWWETQVSTCMIAIRNWLTWHGWQCCLPEGATIASMIIASDKTELSPFKGDKSAWPVYLSIGNVSKKVRCQTAWHTSVLVGYIPVSKLHMFENNLVAGYRLFHSCMKRILEPLVAAGQEGVEMVCAV